MSRLTARTETGHAYLVNIKPDEQDINSPYKNTLQCILDCFERLAQYEDTGLTPEDIEELKKAYIRYGEVLQDNARLRAEAEAALAGQEDKP